MDLGIYSLNEIKSKNFFRVTFEQVFSSFSAMCVAFFANIDEYFEIGVKYFSLT
jgi:hypothetical protein